MTMIMSENHKPVIVIDAGKVLVDIDPEAVLQELSLRCRREIRLPVPGGSWRASFFKYMWENALGKPYSWPSTVLSESRSGSRDGIYSGAES